LASGTSATPLQRSTSGTVAAAACAGVAATISVGPSTIAARAAIPSKNGQQPLPMLVPVILTTVLPAVVPNEGVTVESVADGARNVNPLARLNVSLPHDRVTSAAPGECSTVVAVIELALTKATVAAGSRPIATALSVRRS